MFKLTTRADRIEQLADGSFAILDYKTGATPTEPQVRTGLVAAAHARGRDPARRAASRACTPGSLSEFAYVSLRGREPAGEEKPIEFKEGYGGLPRRHGAGAAAQAWSSASPM